MPIITRCFRGSFLGYILAVFTLGAQFAFAWPQPEEVAKARPIVDELMSSKEKSLHPGEAADAASALADKAKREAARFLLLRKAVELYAKAGDDAKTSAAFMKLVAEVKNVPYKVQESILLGAGRTLPPGKRAKTEALFKGVRALVWAEKELAAARKTLKSTKKAAPEAHLRAGNALAVMGDWPKALDHLLGAEGKIASMADNEINGTATVDKLANAWWEAAERAEEKEEEYVKTAYRLHAVDLYRKALAVNLLEGLNKDLAESRIAKVEKKNDAVVTSPVSHANPLYCVIDLSAGPNASKYPVSYLAEAPKNGWTDEYKTTKLVLRRIEAGSFVMGEDQKNESHRVTLTKPFYIGVFEVTQRQYELVTGVNPSEFKGDMRPVEQMSYDMIRGKIEGAKWPVSSAVDADSFMGKLRARTGLEFDLPAEAQWEYACRAGTTTTYYWGNSINCDYGWYRNNSKRPNDVGIKMPNANGLYDMYGNTWEWCLDWEGKLAYGTDPFGSISGLKRVLRGGSWLEDANLCTSSHRGYGTSSTEATNRGFRLVRTLP